MKEKENIFAVSSPAPEYAPRWRAFLLFLLIAFLIHLLLFLLFRPLPQVQPAGKSESRTHTVLILQDAPDYRKKLENYRLLYALQYLEPRTAILPDMQSGFSSVLDKRKSRRLLPDLAVTSSAKKSLPDNAPFALPERSLGELSPALSRYAPASGGTLQGEPAPEGILLPRGKLGEKTTLGSWLVPDPAADELLHQYGSHAGGPTLLVVRRESEGLPPAIRIISSCGAAALDQLGVRQIALYMGKNPALPEGSKPLYCSILWRLPELKKNIEASK